SPVQHQRGETHGDPRGHAKRASQSAATMLPSSSGTRLALVGLRRDFAEKAVPDSRSPKDAANTQSEVGHAGTADGRPLEASRTCRIFGGAISAIPRRDAW